MLRNVIAVIIGIIAGMALNMGILEINSLAYPIPEGLDIKVPAQLQNYLDTLPAPAFHHFFFSFHKLQRIGIFYFSLKK